MNTDELIALGQESGFPAEQASNANCRRLSRNRGQSGPFSSSNVSSIGEIYVQSIREQVMNAAYQSREHSESVQGHIMPEATLDEITTEVERLPRERLYTDPLVIFSDAIQVRDQIYRLLEQRQYPNQSAHLYYLASVVCAFLASSSFGFGFPRAAVEQTRASAAYAEIIGHDPLRLWNKNMLASLAFWGKRPQRALDLALSTTQWATKPIVQAYLHNGIALFSAQTHRPDDARTALAQAFNAHESSMTGNSALVENLGGMFSYPRTRLLQIATMTYLELGEFDNAESSAIEVIELYETGPAELRALDTEAEARINLGRARLLQGDAEGVQDALRPVFELPPSRRAEHVVSRLQDFYAHLRGHGIAASTQGRRMEENIEEFLDSTAANTFPMLDR